MTPRELWTEFAKHGTVYKVFIPLSKANQRSRGFGFVNVAGKDAEHIIQSMHGKELMGRTLACSLSRKRLGGEDDPL
uniref:RRM domain-containing protein n=1 Tax=Arcella intermedia TaxID=1963864 RepID=A0A6B2LW87_9EUKA